MLVKYLLNLRSFDLRKKFDDFWYMSFFLQIFFQSHTAYLIVTSTGSNCCILNCDPRMVVLSNKSRHQVCKLLVFFTNNQGT